MHPVLRTLAIAWGLLGVLTLLGRALVSLTPLAVQALSSDLAWWQLALGGAWVGFMAYTEGYKGFQKRFAPMVAARVHVLRTRPTLLRALLAPMFCMGLVDATRRRLAVSWGILLGVIALVLVVRFLPQPWRGLVDAGVVVGLGWGTVSLIAHVAWTLATGRTVVDAELAPVVASSPEADAPPHGPNTTAEPASATD